MYQVLKSFLQEISPVVFQYASKEVCAPTYQTMT